MIIPHLLPKGRAWNVTVSKYLRRFVVGLTGIQTDLKAFFDLLWTDILPDSTTKLDEWEEQFGLPANGMSDDDRRDRLDGRWKALGGQSPYYIQNTLRDAGFDVYVYDWWEPGSEPAIGSHACATARNPLLYLQASYAAVSLMVECGEALAQCGEAFAQAGNQVDPRGYPLVNKTYATVPDYVMLCGEADAECGEALAECGEYDGYIQAYVDYIVPNDPLLWPYFWYVGGPSFGDIAQVLPSRKNEFEELILKIGPLHLWVGVLVEYV